MKIILSKVCPELRDIRRKKCIHAILLSVRLQCLTLWKGMKILSSLWVAEKRPGLRGLGVWSVDLPTHPYSGDDIPKGRPQMHPAGSLAPPTNIIDIMGSATLLHNIYC